MSAPALFHILKVRKPRKFPRFLSCERLFSAFCAIMRAKTTGGMLWHSRPFSSGCGASARRPIFPSSYPSTKTAIGCNLISTASGRTILSASPSSFGRAAAASSSLRVLPAICPPFCRPIATRRSSAFTARTAREGASQALLCAFAALRGLIAKGRNRPLPRCTNKFWSFSTNTIFLRSNRR